MMIMTKEEDDKKTKKKAAPKAKPKVEEKKAEVTAPAPKPEPKAEKVLEPKAEAPNVEAKAEPAKEAQKPVEAKHEKKETKAKKKAPKKEAKRVFVVRGKRKESVARATISPGKGVIRLNSQNVSAINNHYIREIIVEPLRYIGPESNNVDISITVNGGGVMGQAQAARTAIAHALAVYFDGMNLKEKFDAIDRSLLIEDTRRVETKKFRGPKARARFQKSYR